MDKHAKLQRGFERCGRAEQSRQSANARLAAKARDEKATVAVDLRTCIAYSTNQNPQETVNALLLQQQPPAP